MAKPSQARNSSIERVPARGGGLPLPELLAILRRRRHVIFWVTTVATTVAILIGLQVTKTYTATAQVMIEPRESRIVQAEKVAPGLPAEDNAIVETHIKLIQSRATLARAVENLDLVSDPALLSSQPRARPFRGRARGAPGGMAARLAGRSAAGPLGRGGRHHSDPTRGPDRDVLRDQAIDRLQGDVKVTQSGQSYVLLISYTSPRPHEAVRIANGIATAYVDVQLDEKLSATRRASTWLGEQVEQLRWRVFGSELAIEEFRASNGIVDTDASRPRYRTARGPHELPDRCAGRALRQGSAAAQPARDAQRAAMAWNPRPRCCPRR